MPARQTLSPDNIKDLAQLAQVKLRSGGAEGVELRGLAWSPDSLQVAASILAVQLLQAETLVEVPVGDTFGPIAFSLDGRTLASAPGNIQLWDVATGQMAQEIESSGGLIESIAFSPDGRSLATASDDGNVTLWELDSGQPRRTPAGHNHQVFSVAFSPDGRTLASVGADRVLRLWGVPLP